LDDQQGTLNLVSTGAVYSEEGPTGSRRVVLSVSDMREPPVPAKNESANSNFKLNFKLNLNFSLKFNLNFSLRVGAELELGLDFSSEAEHIKLNFNFKLKFKLKFEKLAPSFFAGVSHRDEHAARTPAANIRNGRRNEVHTAHLQVTRRLVL
jgi:hypothetical protein